MTTTPNQTTREEIDPIDPVSPLVEAFRNDGEPFTVADTDDARLAINSFARFAALQSPIDREGDRLLREVAESLERHGESTLCTRIDAHLSSKD